MSRSMTAHTEPDPEHVTCFLCTATSRDNHVCEECENYFCDAHGDKGRCAECLQADLRAWLDLLGESEDLRRRCNYRVGRAWRSIPYLTSDGARKQWRLWLYGYPAEEWDGKRWLPLPKEAE